MHFHPFIVTTKSIPPYLKNNHSYSIGSVIITFVQPIVPYFKPYNRPFNYLEYKNDSDLDVHVWIFKAVFKTNGEMVDEEITNLFNFTLRNNALDWCNNNIWDHPNCRFIGL